MSLVTHLSVRYGGSEPQSRGELVLLSVAAAAFSVKCEGTGFEFFVIELCLFSICAVLMLPLREAGVHSEVARLWVALDLELSGICFGSLLVFKRAGVE